MLHSNEPMSTQNKVIIGVILVLLFILGVLVTYKILSSKEEIPVVTTEEKPLFGPGAQDVILGTATSTEGETNVRLEGGPATELATTKVNPGESATITWSSPDAVSCVASGDDKTWFFTGGSPVGSFETPPITKDTVYAISCIDALGNATRKTVLVSPTRPTTLARVTTSFSNFFSGGSTSGTGTTGGATGTRTTPYYSSSYSGSITSTSRSSTGLTISLSASKTRITQGESLVLTWSFSGDGSCMASGAWAGVKSVNGTESISSVPIGYNVYTISCTNTKGEARSKSLSISGVPPTPTITSFAADTSRVSSGGTTTLRWTSVNTTSCSTDTAGKWATQSTTLPSNGSMNTQPLINTLNESGISYRFTLKCVSGTGSMPTTRTVVVYADKARGPSIAIQAELPTINIDRQRTNTITWNVTGGTSCTASGGWSGEKTLSGSEVVTVSSVGKKTYTLNCTGPNGSSGAQADFLVLENPPSVGIEVTCVGARDGGKYYCSPGLIEIKWSVSKQALCKTSENGFVADITSGLVGNAWGGNVIGDRSGSKWILFSGNETRYGMICDGNGGQASGSRTVGNYADWLADQAEDLF